MLSATITELEAIMNINYQVIGKRIKKRREQLHMTQMELAEITDLSVPYISYIETGKKKLSLGTLINITNALSISPNELLMDHLSIITEGTESDVFISLMDCTDKEKQFILDILTSIKSTIRMKGWIK